MGHFAGAARGEKEQAPLQPDTVTDSPTTNAKQTVVITTKFSNSCPRRKTGVGGVQHDVCPRLLACLLACLLFGSQTCGLVLWPLFFMTAAILSGIQFDLRQRPPSKE